MAVGSLVAAAALSLIGMYVGFSLEADRREQAALKAKEQESRAAVRDVELALASARTAFDTGDLTVAHRKLGEAQSRLQSAGSLDAGLDHQIASLEKEITAWRQDKERFEQFMNLAPRAGRDVSTSP